MAAIQSQDCDFSYDIVRTLVDRACDLSERKPTFKALFDVTRRARPLPA
jgi:hypothetical protein